MHVVPLPGHLAEGRKCLKATYEALDNLADLELAASAIEHNTPLRIRTTGDSIAGVELEHHKLALSRNVAACEATHGRFTRVMALLGGLRNVGLLVGASTLSLWRLINLM